MLAGFSWGLFLPLVALVIALNFFFSKKVSNDVPFRVPNAAQINMHWGRNTLTIHMIMSSFTDSVKHIYCLS